MNSPSSSQKKLEGKNKGDKKSLTHMFPLNRHILQNKMKIITWIHIIPKISTQFLSLQTCERREKSKHQKNEI